MSKTILLADDSLTIQKVVELTFMEEDFEVVSVSDGDEALARLKDLTPSLVIADVHMPGASGYEVCKTVKQEHPEVPVLLLAGTFEAFDEDEARLAGADGHLKKPFDSQELLQRVEQLVASREEGSGQPAEATPEPLEEVVDAVELPQAENVSLEEETQGPEPGAWEVEPVVEGVIVQDIAATPAPVDAPETSSGPSGVDESSADKDLTLAGLSDEDVDRIARRVVERLGEDIVREISWEVIPDLAEIVIKNRLRELEEQVD